MGIISCVCIQDLEEAYCRDRTKASPNLETMSVDMDGKRVHTEAMQYWSAPTRFVNCAQGFILK